jgi:hypothetical protein
MSEPQRKFRAMARWERYAPLTGVAAVVLWVIGVVVSESGAARPEDERAENILAWYADNENTIITGELIFVLGVLFFIWFLGSLRSTLFAAEGGTGRVSLIVFGSGLLAALGMILQAAALIQPTFADEGELSGEAAQAMSLLSDATFGVVEVTLIPMLVAAGIVILRHGALPRWLAWFSFLLALVLAIIPIGWAGLLFVFPLWVLVTSVLLYQRSTGEPIAAPPSHA